MSKDQPNDPFTNVFGIVGFFIGLGVGWQFSQSILGAFIAALILAAIGAAIGNIIFRILIFGVCLLAFFIRRAVTREVVKAVTNTETHSSPQLVVPTPSSSPSWQSPTPSAPSVPLDHALYLKNECSKTIQIALCYQTTNNEWKTDGWWTWKGNESRFLRENDNEKILLTSPDVYVYAYITGSEYSWVGSYEQKFKGRDLPMRKFSLQADNAGDYILSLNCFNLDTVLNNEKDKMLSRRINGCYRLGFQGTDLYPCFVDGSNTNGILVNVVFDNSPASEAGLQKGDIIYQVDNNSIGTITRMFAYLNQKENPADDVNIYYVRNGDLYKATATPAHYDN